MLTFPNKSNTASQQSEEVNLKYITPSFNNATVTVAKGHLLYGSFLFNRKSTGCYSNGWHKGV